MICAAAGLFCGALLVIFLGYKQPHDRQRMFVCSLFAIFFMFVGAHLLFFLVGLPDFTAKYGASIYDVGSFLTAVLNAASGMVFYGGLFGAAAGVWIFCRILRLPVRPYLNVLSCAFPLMHAFGRLGCTLGGCCYGIEYHGILSIQYTDAHINPGISDHIADFARFPVQPLEAVLEVILCCILVSVYLKTVNRYPIFAVYLFVYGIIRFFDEFLRGDSIRGLWGPFSTSQWIALACIIGTMIYYLRIRRLRQRTV
ncbi:MAG: prolipoprotein diacylglyceryl transferase [Parasporobacterium sp.]|nr:prolipoprotein diacylglyceryl transferase [Parasporobacterium sp.]